MRSSLRNWDSKITFFAFADVITSVCGMLIFITLLLATMMQGEGLRRPQMVGLGLATLGIATIGTHSIGAGASVTPWGLTLVLGAALCWAAANLVSRRIGRVDMLAFMVWSSVFAVPPLLLLSLWVDGPSRILEALPQAGWGAWLAVLWQAVGNTLFGFGAWSWLLSRHPTATVTPMALLVPVFGMGASALVLGEPLQNWKLLAGALVMSGLAVNVLASYRHRPA